MNVEVRVVVMTNDDREDAAERLTEEVRRALSHPFGDRVYVELMPLVKR